MKIVSATSMLLLIALTLACGYSKKAAAPPTAGNVPAISQLNPDATTSGGPAFVMTVNGSSFSGKAVVNWNGAALASSTAVISANQLTVTVPAAMIASPATVQVTVTNPGTPGTGLYGGGGTLAETSTPMSFTIN